MNAAHCSFVLVHGARHGPFVWQNLPLRLRALGDTATDLTGLGDVTGLGERRHIGNDSTDLERHIDDLVSHVEMEDLKRCHNVWSGNADQTRAH